MTPREIIDKYYELASAGNWDAWCDLFHADYVMDAVGPEVVPSLDQIRARFDDRRQNPGSADGLLRRLMGMDAKLKQYTDGRRFVAGVVDQVGIDGFNQVWTSPETLPTTAEIADPGAWVRRVAT